MIVYKNEEAPSAVTLRASGTQHNFGVSIMSLQNNTVIPINKGPTGVQTLRESLFELEAIVMHLETISRTDDQDASEYIVPILVKRAREKICDSLELFEEAI